MKLDIENATFFAAPFPHLELYPACDGASFRTMLEALPPSDSFTLAGRGQKLELDLIEGTPPFSALTASQQDNLLDLRQAVRDAAAYITRQFAEPLREKYIWLLGEAIAEEVLAAGYTTTNGRIMGRGPGFRLKPHTDSAHFGATCLLYLSDASTPEDGALTLYCPARMPEVREATTYYPLKAEGIESEVAKTIPVRRNLFVSFVSGPSSVHGFQRQSESAAAWRFAYQCHVMPRGLNMRQMVFRLSEPHRARWAAYLTGAPSNSY